MEKLPFIVDIPRHTELCVFAIEWRTGVIIGLDSNTARIFTFFCSWNSIIYVSRSSDNISILLDISFTSIPLMQGIVFKWRWGQNNIAWIICNTCIFAHASQFAFNGLRATFFLAAFIFPIGSWRECSVCRVSIAWIIITLMPFGTAFNIASYSFNLQWVLYTDSWSQRRSKKFEYDVNDAVWMTPGKLMAKKRMSIF